MTHKWVIVSIPTNSGSSLIYGYIGHCARATILVEGHWGMGTAWAHHEKYKEYRRVMTQGGLEEHYRNPDNYRWPAIIRKWEGTLRKNDQAVYDNPEGILSVKSTFGPLISQGLAPFLPPDTRWIFGLRNPYAFCEGVRRREQHPLALSARHWLRTAALQQENMEKLPAHLYVSYEDQADQPEEVSRRVREFIPALSDFTMDGTLEKPTILGRQKALINMNDVQIGKLSPEDKAEITAVLREDEKQVSHFGYSLL